MAHYALIRDDEHIVVQVFVGRDENDLAPGIDDWETYYAIESHYVRRTSFNTRGGVHYDSETGEPSADQTKALRFNYAGIGYTFDPDKGTDGAFIPAKPYESWVLDETTCLWAAPVPMPEDGQFYVWDEAAGEWVVSE